MYPAGLPARVTCGTAARTVVFGVWAAGQVARALASNQTPAVNKCAFGACLDSLWDHFLTKRAT